MNAAGSTDWVSAVSILAGGLILGLLFAYFFNRRKSARMLDADLERKDLEAKRDVLVQQLRELDADAAPKERIRLENETAKVLKALDGYRATSPKAAAPAQPSSGAFANPAVRGFLWGFGSFAAVAFLGYLVWQSANPRTENGPVTGGGPAGMQTAQQQPQQMPADPALQSIEAQVKATPDNLALRNQLAQAYLERDNLMGVFEQTKYVLERNPDDSRALAFQGLVRMAMGDAAGATRMLQHATKSDPTNLDAHVGLAWVYSQQGKEKEAEASIAEAARISPKDKPRLDAILAQMHNAGQQATTPVAQGSGELPPGHPVIDPTQSAQAAPAAAGGPSVTVTVALARTSATGVLYIIARNPAGGPPIAVHREAAPRFPFTYTLSSADSMMGQQLPQSFRLEARLDSDGDAMSKNPNDPAAMQDNVAPGSTVKLALQ
ncbi:MAG TPA: tetratricopeptide repeat protein [Thermoanaerobaculia bacterium]|nr:tetratricopeptide repeat protein [Thermoanaerobaculia bacterium]